MLIINKIFKILLNKKIFLNKNKTLRIKDLNIKKLWEHNKKWNFFIKKKKIIYNLLIHVIIKKINDFTIIENYFKIVFNVVNNQILKIELIIKLHHKNLLIAIFIKRHVKILLIITFK